MNAVLILFGSAALIFAYARITNASLLDFLDPESAILLLLGFGLITLAGIGRKTIFKKKK
jgi:hypothetical protein